VIKSGTNDGYCSLDAALVNARGDDIDLYGKMLLTTLIGVDETRHLLFMKGGEL